MSRFAVNDPKRILIINTFGIGDVLFTTPLLSAIKTRFPQASVYFLGNERTLPFLKNDPRIDEAFCYERDDFVAVYKKSPIAFLCKWHGFLKEIRSRQFDVIFDMSMNAGLGLVCKLAGIPYRVGLDYKGRGRWLTHKLSFKGYENRHVAEYYLDLFDLWVGEAERGVDRHIPMKLIISQEDGAWANGFMLKEGLSAGKFFVMYPGGGASWGKGAGLKRWPAVKFAKLADKMIEKETLPIILMGDKNEVALCEEVASEMRQKAVMLAGKTTITQAAALMKVSRLVVANDGGPLHIAVASGARTASIFGPVDPRVYGPYPAEGHKVITADLPCRPCYRFFRMSDCKHSSCLRDLSVDKVYETIQELL